MAKQQQQWAPDDYRRPETIPPGACWVTVQDVEGGNGDHEHERAWACAVPMAQERDGFRYWGETVDYAARSWYRDTDQSGDCAVTLRMETHDGGLCDMRVALAWSLRTIVRIVEAE